MKFALITSFLFVALSGQSQIGMQDWRIHFSAFNVAGIAESENSVFMACSNGLVEYDLTDNSISMLTATNGLSDLGASAIGSEGNVVIVGYANGNLDIIETDVITNIPWIQKAEISGDKAVNNFYFDQNIIYVCTNIGLVVLDNQRKEIKDTYYPYDNPVVNDATVFEDTLFLATAQGIYKAHIDAPFLNDKNQWTQETNLPANLLSANFELIETFGTKLMFSYNTTTFESDSIYYYENHALNTYSSNPVEISGMNSDDGKLVLSLFGKTAILDDNLAIENSVFDVQGRFPNPEGALLKDGQVWSADARNGLVKGNDSWNSQSIFSDTPYADGTYRMDVQYGTVLIAGGGLTHNLQSNYYRNGVYQFKDESWTNFNHENQDSMAFDTNWDFISVVINPNNTDEVAFASSSKGGLMIVEDGVNVSTVYNETNSLIERINGNIVISDMKYDQQGNLWILNKGIEPLKMLSTEGIWYSFSLGSAAKEQHPYRLLIDNNGVKWVGVNQVGLVAFSDGGTFDDGSDDQWRTLSAAEGYGNLPSVFVKALAQDVDGEIWIGTDFGMTVLYNTSNVFDGDFGEYDSNPILIEVDGEVEKLLGESDITSITVDGGNRKWIATSSSGVFCLSPDGTEEIYRYNKDNSPLISNNVFDIRTDLLSGETYFATESGLVSVRTDASLGDPEFSNVTVFPNPVRPEYQGPVTVQGLGYQSDVKITDVSGNVVYKTTSNGGTVIWDGKTLQGERAKSGVYLVWSASVSGKGKEVAKILFIN
ncbi:MAG: ligand-binding sensor domain-containing protein [Arenicella sp.]|jgi:ligand-binding sensor domain-containing protein